MRFLLFISLFFTVSFTHAQQWEQLADFPGTARDDGTGFVIGDSAYFGTGLTPWWSTERSFYGLDLINETWFPVDSLPIGKERQYACGFNGYVFGGFDGTNFLNDLWKYDPITNSWTEKSSLPSVGRSGSACFVINDTAYIVGGRTATNVAMNEIWAYSIINDNWVQKNNLTFGNRWRSSAIELNGTGYLLFGKDELDDFHNEYYAYDPLLDNWSPLAAFPSPGRSHATLMKIDNSLYACFGIDSLNNSYNDLWKYDVSLDQWSILPGLPSVGRRGGIALPYQSKFFYATGVDESDQRLVETWKYDPSLSLEELNTSSNKELVKITDLMGRETEFKPNTVLLYIYSDGTTERVYRVE